MPVGRFARGHWQSNLKELAVHFNNLKLGYSSARIRLQGHLREASQAACWYFRPGPTGNLKAQGVSGAPGISSLRARGLQRYNLPVPTLVNLHELAAAGAMVSIVYSITAALALACQAGRAHWQE